MSETSEERNRRLRETEIYKQTRERIKGIELAIHSIPEYKGFLSYGRIMRNNFAKCYEKWLESERISRILRDIKTRDEFNCFRPESQSMIKMLVYLGLVESVGVTLMDIILLMLVANGKEIHTRGAHAKHVETFEDLESIWDLDYKLSFLDSVEISIFREKIINKDLRDKIAHLRFKIQDDGTIQKKDNGYNFVDVDNEISEFWDGVDTINLIFEELRVWEKLSQFYEEDKAVMKGEKDGHGKS